MSQSIKRTSQDIELLVYSFQQDIRTRLEQGYEDMQTEILHTRDPFKTIRALLPLLADDQRAELFSGLGEYCDHCGRDDPNCQCENDE